MTDELDDYAEKYDEQFRTRKPPRSLLAKGSRAIRITEQDPETGEWRTYIRMSRVKFDDEAKARFLDEYRKWGRMGESSAAAGDLPPNNAASGMLVLQVEVAPAWNGPSYVKWRDAKAEDLTVRDSIPEVK